MPYFNERMIELETTKIAVIPRISRTAVTPKFRIHKFGKTSENLEYIEFEHFLYVKCSKQDLKKVEEGLISPKTFIEIEGEIYKRTIYSPLYLVYPKKTDATIIKISVRKCFPQSLPANARFFYASQYKEAVAFAKYICPLNGQISFKGFIETF